MGHAILLLLLLSPRRRSSSSMAILLLQSVSFTDSIRHRRQASHPSLILQGRGSGEGRSCTVCGRNQDSCSYSDLAVQEARLVFVFLAVAVIVLLLLCHCDTRRLDLNN
ncbi:hypothetical protein LXL04_014367 [Taraxacum kok-saghyz]